jgi:hypothetical protein
MRTYQALYKNEIRAVEVKMNDQDGQPFLSDAASAAIYDSDGDIVVAEQAAYSVSNSVYTVVGRTTTANRGKYKIVWKIKKGDYTYYHATDLEIQEL